PIHFVFDIDEQTYLKYTRLAGTGERPSSREHENPVFVTLSDDVDFLREGKMNFVDNNIDRGTGTMRGRAIFQNADLLLTPGMFGRVRIMGSGLYQAMIVPDEAVGSDQGRRIVYVVNDQNEVTVKPVEIGRAIDDMRVIKSGIASGDRIVINGLQRVRPGLVVSPENQMLSPPAHPMIRSMASRGAEPTSAAEETATGANIDATGAEMPQAGSAGAMEETSSP
ncbi:MAG: efflux RND transporter periplasmic adaptor subunit, partial [Alphaproteobacteria bacterium]|nr:efflux RND transporter periplasmic adaptor subunit [Alphaproteobacteria bacterium]